MENINQANLLSQHEVRCDGGYNVTSEILSFLSPAHLPVQITPTRWNPSYIIKSEMKSKQI